MSEIFGRQRDRCKTLEVIRSSSINIYDSVFQNGLHNFDITETEIISRQTTYSHINSDYYYVTLFRTDTAW